MVGFAYVDDSDLIQSSNDPLEVLILMQEVINSWGYLMEVSLGAICTDKRWWYLVEYFLSKGKWIVIYANVKINLTAKDTERVWV